MPILFRPKRGQILICDFDTGFRPPEMIKVRPVVVVSPRRRTGPGLCTVVPLSSAKPEPPEPYHHPLSPLAYPPARGPMWAKCDMLATVSCARLDRVMVRLPCGKREYRALEMPEADMAAIEVCLRIAPGDDKPAGTSRKAPPATVGPLSFQAEDWVRACPGRREAPF